MHVAKLVQSVVHNNTTDLSAGVITYSVDIFSMISSGTVKYTQKLDGHTPKSRSFKCMNNIKVF